MPRITRAQFLEKLADGIDTNNADLAAKLASANVAPADIRALDADNNGLITGKELLKAFELVDRYDPKSSANSFHDHGKAADVFKAFVVGALPKKGKFADKIVAAAADRLKSPKAYVKADPSQSNNPHLEGNVHPNRSQLTEFKGAWKCNLFVGDVLYQAGVKMPVYKNADGSYHYVEAEKWPRYPNLFDKVTDPSKVQVGDLLVRDFPGDAGSGGGHIEVVVGIRPLETAGAHETGAYVSGGNWLSNVEYDSKLGGFVDMSGKPYKDGSRDVIYVLRPKLSASK